MNHQQVKDLLRWLIPAALALGCTLGIVLYVRDWLDPQHSGRRFFRLLWQEIRNNREGRGE
jgi:hypothetical protein